MDIHARKYLYIIYYILGIYNNIIYIIYVYINCIRRNVKSCRTMLMICLEFHVFLFPKINELIVSIK